MPGLLENVRPIFAGVLEDFSKSEARAQRLIRTSPIFSAVVDFFSYRKLTREAELAGSRRREALSLKNLILGQTYLSELFPEADELTPEESVRDHPPGYSHTRTASQLSGITNMTHMLNNPGDPSVTPAQRYFETREVYRRQIVEFCAGLITERNRIQEITSDHAAGQLEGIIRGMHEAANFIVNFYNKIGLNIDDCDAINESHHPYQQLIAFLSNYLTIYTYDRGIQKYRLDEKVHNIDDIYFRGSGVISLSSNERETIYRELYSALKLLAIYYARLLVLEKMLQQVGVPFPSITPHEHRIIGRKLLQTYCMANTRASRVEIAGNMICGLTILVNERIIPCLDSIVHMAPPLKDQWHKLRASLITARIHLKTRKDQEQQQITQEQEVLTSKSDLNACTDEQTQLARANVAKAMQQDADSFPVDIDVKNDLKSQLDPYLASHIGALSPNVSEDRFSLDNEGSIQISPILARSQLRSDTPPLWGSLDQDVAPKNGDELLYSASFDSRDSTNNSLLRVHMSGQNPRTALQLLTSSRRVRT